VVEAKKSAQPLARFDRTITPYRIGRRADEPVVDPLVIALAVVVLDVLAHYPSKVAFPDRNDLR